jgi:hypothetical protein
MANTQFAGREGFAIGAEFTEVETGKGADARDRRPQIAALPIAGIPPQDSFRCHTHRKGS